MDFLPRCEINMTEEKIPQQNKTNNANFGGLFGTPVQQTQLPSQFKILNGC